MDYEFDITDQAEVRVRLSALRDELVKKSRSLDELREEIEELEELIRFGAGLSRGSGRALEGVRRPRRRRAAPAQDRAVRALEEASAALAGTAVGPTSLFNYMVRHGLDTPKDAAALGTNLWDAWRAGRIRRAPNGVYLPLDGTGRTEVDYPLTDYYYASEQGLSVPSTPSRPGREARERM